MSEPTCKTCIHHNDEKCHCYHPGCGGTEEEGWSAFDDCIEDGHAHYCPRNAVELIARAEEQRDRAKQQVIEMTPACFTDGEPHGRCKSFNDCGTDCDFCDVSTALADDPQNEEIL